ncbi:MAG: hypothetical protein AB7Q97_17140 [Gammaproteobacteria bacterium]
MLGERRPDRQHRAMARGEPSPFAGVVVPEPTGSNAVARMAARTQHRCMAGTGETALHTLAIGYAIPWLVALLGVGAIEALGALRRRSASDPPAGRPDVTDQ